MEKGDMSKRYEIICPYCGKVQYACKSIFHEWGVADGGHGCCLGCRKAMRLVFSERLQAMKAERWEEVDIYEGPEVK